MLGTVGLADRATDAYSTVRDRTRPRVGAGLGGRARTPLEVGELRELAGSVAPVVMAGEQLLPVGGELASLLPGGGLRRGSVVGVGAGGCVGADDHLRQVVAGAGATSVVFSLVAAASAEGSWVAFVGYPSIGWVAAAEAGVDLRRVAVVANPGGQWALVAAALIDAMDVVVVRQPRRVRAADARRLMSRARERGAVLVVDAGSWPEAVDVRMVARASRWTGIGNGFGALRARRVELVRTGRGAAGRERLDEVAV